MLENNAMMLITKALSVAIMVVMLCPKVTTFDDFYGTLNLYSAVAALTYRDPVSKMMHNDTEEVGRYGTFSRLDAESGVLVHIKISDQQEQPCISGIALPSERWIAFLEKGSCKAQQGDLTPSVLRNASAIVLYKYDDESEIDPYSRNKKQKVEDIVHIYLNKAKGDRIATLLANGTRVHMYISVGRLLASHYNSMNKTSMLFLSISFIVLMIISFAWLIFYYVQRSRYSYAKERLSKRLCSAAKKAISKMPLRTVKSGDAEMEAEYDVCTVCIDSYKSSDVIRQLPCKHEFHKHCIDPWLMEHQSCPICKINILKALGLQVCRSHDSTLNIDVDVASTSFAYSEFVVPERNRDFDSDGVEIVRFQLAHIEHHSGMASRQTRSADGDENRLEIGSPVEPASTAASRNDDACASAANVDERHRADAPAPDATSRASGNHTESNKSEDSEPDETQSLMSGTREGDAVERSDS